LENWHFFSFSLFAKKEITKCSPKHLHIRTTNNFRNVHLTSMVVQIGYRDNKRFKKWMKECNHNHMNPICCFFF
jgi:hypothetical protein